MDLCASSTSIGIVKSLVWRDFLESCAESGVTKNVLMNIFALFLFVVVFFGAEGRVCDEGRKIIQGKGIPKESYCGLR